MNNERNNKMKEALKVVFILTVGVIATTIIVDYCNSTMLLKKVDSFSLKNLIININKIR